MVPMLIGMSDHSSDLAGLAVFAEPLADKHRKYSLYSGSAFNWQGLAQAYQTHFGIEANLTTPIGDRAVLISELSPYTVKLIRFYGTKYYKQILSFGQYPYHRQ